MQEFPAFQQVYDKYNGQFEILSIAVDDKANPQALVTNAGYNWQFGLSETAAAGYNFNAIPYTLFIDRTGKIVDQRLGGMEAAEFESKLAKIL